MIIPTGHSGWSKKKRNFGYGRQLKYAALSALHDHYGLEEHHQTKHTHCARFGAFTTWIRDNYSIKDARGITKNHVEHYGEDLLEDVNDEECSVTYAQNLLSTVNVVLGCLRHDKRLLISPAELVGRRAYIRQTIPQGDWKNVALAVAELDRKNNPRAAAALRLTRAFGMRVREAALADLHRLYKEGIANGECIILEGTKGGRRADDRCIPMGDAQWEALNYAMQHSPDGSKNLIDSEEKYTEFLYRVINPARQTLKQYDLKSYREMRAAFAVDTYEEEAGHPAPIKSKPVNQEAHLRALLVTSKRLGHNRPEIAHAYVG